MGEVFPLYFFAVGWVSPDARGGLLLSFACSAPNGKKV